MGRRQYRSEEYKGVVITFDKLSNGFVGARAPSRTSQYLGIGKTKQEAFEDLKNSVDIIDKAGNWHKKPQKGAD